MKKTGNAQDIQDGSVPAPSKKQKSKYTNKLTQSDKPATSEEYEIRANVNLYADVGFIVHAANEEEARIVGAELLDNATFTITSDSETQMNFDLHPECVECEIYEP